jgi:hypothetical protein
MKIDLIISIDTECDKGEGWKVKQPFRFENVLRGIPDRLQPVFEKFNIIPTFLLSPEVMLNDKCVSLFRSLGQRIDLGTHLHAEFIPPHENMRAEDTRQFQSSLGRSEECEKLANLTRLFQDRFGYSPRTFRAGRFGLSHFTLSILEDLGYEIDSSVTPFMWWWQERGKGVNFLGAPSQPYFPEVGDFRKKGSMKILEVPVTLVNRFWERFPRSFLLAMNPLARWQTVLMNVVLGKRLRSLWLRPTYSTSGQMMSVTEHLAGKVTDGRLTLCMMFHSNEATPGASPYHLTEDSVSAFLDRIQSYLLSLFLKFEVESIPLSHAAQPK